MMVRMVVAEDVIVRKRVQSGYGFLNLGDSWRRDSGHRVTLRNAAKRARVNV